MNKKKMIGLFLMIIVLSSITTLMAEAAKPDTLRGKSVQSQKDPTTETSTSSTTRSNNGKKPDKTIQTPEEDTSTPPPDTEPYNNTVEETSATPGNILEEPTNTDEPSGNTTGVSTSPPQEPFSADPLEENNQTITQETNTTTAEPLFNETIVTPEADPVIQQNTQSLDKWRGVGTDYKITMDNTRSIDQVLIQWQQEIPKLKANNLNMVRLSFGLRDSDHHSRIIYSDMDQIIQLLGENGFYIVLDMHNWQDHQGVFGSDVWINFWAETANHYKDNPYVIAYEIFNEPFTSTWMSGLTGDGAGRYDGSEGVAKALARCVDAIRYTGDDHIIVYPDPWYWRPFSETWTPETWRRSSTYRENVVITVHEWLEESYINNWQNQMSTRISKMRLWAEQYPVWMGEFGVYEESFNVEAQLTYASTLVNEVAGSKYTGFCFWLHGYPSRDLAWSLCTQVIS